MEFGLGWIFRSVRFLLEVLFYVPIWYFDAEQRANRKLKKKRAKPVPKIKDGEHVKVIGTALPISQELLAPLTKRKCIYYQVEVDRDFDGDDTIIDENPYSPFGLRTDEADIIVRPLNAMGLLKFDKVFRTGILGKAKNELKHILDKYDFEEKFMGIRMHFTFKEGIIIENDRIAVLGTASWTKDENGKSVLHIFCDENRKMFISNKKKAIKAQSAKYNTEFDQYKTSL